MPKTRPCVCSCVLLLHATAYALNVENVFLADSRDEHVSEDNFDVWVKKEPVPRLHYKAMQDTLLMKSNNEHETESPFIALHDRLSPKMKSDDCNTTWDHTWVYRQGCRYTETTSQGVLVACTGRSGSDFLRHVFKDLGLKVAHDGKQRGLDGSVSWPHAFRSETCKLPHFTEPRYYTFTTAFLLTRHPLKQIASRSNKGKGWDAGYPACVTSMTNAKLDQDDLLRTMQHWVLWNTFAMTYADSFFRVEDLAEEPHLVAGVCKAMAAMREDVQSLCDKQRVESAINELGSNTNSGHTTKSGNVTWGHLAELEWSWLGTRDFTVMAQKLAAKFGYTVPEDETIRDLREIRCAWKEEEAQTPKWSCALG